MTPDLVENQLRLALQSLPIPAFAYDEAGVMRFINDEFIAVTGYSREDLPTLRDWLRRAYGDEFVVEQALAAAKAGFDDASRRLECPEHVVRMANGSQRIWSLSCRTVRPDPAGESLIFTIAVDATEAQTVEKALRDSEARARLAVEIGEIGIFESEHIDKNVHCDARVRDIWGLDPGEPMTAESFLAGIHPDDRQKALDLYIQVCKSGYEGTTRTELRVVNRKTRNIRTLDLRGRVMFENGRAVRSIGALTDVTEARAAEQALRNSEERLRLATEVGGFGAYEYDVKRDQLHWDRRLREIWGFTPDETVTYRAYLDAIHPDDRAHVRQTHTRAADPAGGDRYSIEYRVINRQTGRVSVVSARALVMFENGEPVRAFGALTDVTEARAAEQALRNSEERLRLATEIGEIGAFETDLVGGRLIWDARVRAIWGFGPEEPITIDEFFDALHPDDRGRVRKSLEALADPASQGRCDMEYRVVNRQDRAERVVSVKARAINENGRITRIIGALTDVTEARAAEQALRESEARARLAAEIGQIGAFEANMGKPKLVWDQRAREMFGFGPDDPVTPFDFLAGIHPDDRARAFTLFERAIRRTDDPSGEGEFRIINRRTGEVRAVRGSARVFFENGKPVRVLGAVTDVTAERDASAELERQVEARTRELAQAQTRLAQAQRMEALGHLAGGIAHDFNNVLQAIEAATDLIERKPEPTNLPRYLRMLREGTKRGSAVSRRLSSLSRRPELEPEKVATAPFLEEIAGVLRRTVEGGVEVELEIAPNCPAILADRRQLETALINIAANAREAIRGAGQIKLTARADTAQGATAPPFGVKLRLGNYVRLEIADSGHGMTTDVRARAAEPFFSTKPRGQGVGLGLSMARGFAEQSGGALEIASAPDEGTTVALWLPVAEIAVAEPPPPGPGAKGRLLLVDDDPLIRELVGEHLREAGYSVTECEEGRAALQHLDSGLTVDLLLTDFAMPEMNGVTLAHEARRRRPKLPVIVLTGYASEAADAAGDTELSLLRKPIDSAALVGRVAELIARA